MDQNHPAWRLAEAVHTSHAKKDLDKRLRELKPMAATIALAYALSIRTAPFSEDSANFMVLQSQLQVALMLEHVAAQRLMGRTINWLTWVLIVLTLLLVVFGGLDIWQRWHAGDLPWQSKVRQSFAVSRTGTEPKRTDDPERADLLRWP